MMIGKTDLVDKVKETIDEYNMLISGDKVLVSVSAGPDSMALLHTLLKLKNIYDINLHLFHLDHLTRKGQSSIEAQFVKELSEKLGLKLTLNVESAEKYAKKRGLSFETGARELRLNLIQKVANQEKITKIATGHNANDLAETILMRLMRGTGTKGMIGISPTQGKFIRPLIYIFRDEIEKFCYENKINYRVDQTNLESYYFRNAIRNRLIPLMREISKKDFLKNLINFSKIYLEEDRFLNSLTKKIYYKISKRKNDDVYIPIIELKNLPPAINRRLLRLAIEEKKGELLDISFNAVEDIIDSLKNETEFFEFNLPKFMKVVKDKENLVIKKIEKQKIFFKKEIPIEGTCILETLNLVIETKIVDGKDAKIKDDKTTAYLDYESIIPKLYVRPWEFGDRFIPLGLDKGKKLQDFFVDEKIAREKRKTIPILVDSEKIVWIVGYRIDERVKVKPETRKVLIINVKELN